MIRTATFALAAILAPAFAVGAQTTTQQPATTTTQQPATTTTTEQTTTAVKPKHHSLIAGAATGAVAGHEVGKHTTGHGHAVLGAIAGAEVQHHRNKAEKKAYKQQQMQAQQAAPATNP